MKRVLASVLFTVVIGTAAAALACTNIATCNISDSSGRPGDRITITGSSFGNSSPAGRRTSEPLPVRIRWNGADGPVLAEVLPDGAGNISAAITIPDVNPGRYVIFAVQQDRDGYHMYGTPARIAFEVLTADGRSAAGPTRAAPEPATDGSSGWELPVMLVVLGILGGTLFLAGFAAVMRLLAPGEATSPGRVSSA